jgi:hypothetical protein
MERGSEGRARTGYVDPEPAAGVTARQDVLSDDSAAEGRERMGESFIS